MSAQEAKFGSAFNTKAWLYVFHAAISMKQRCQYFITLNLQNKAQPISCRPSLQTSVCLLNKVSYSEGQLQIKCLRKAGSTKNFNRSIDVGFPKSS